MTGSPCSNSGTQARHPNLLQQQGCRDNGISDKLRRMAIKNAYESRSLCGASSTEPDTALVEKASAGKLLPSVASKPSPNPHRYSSRSKRPAQKTLSTPSRSSRTGSVAAIASVTGSRKVQSPSTVHDVGASAGDDPEIMKQKTDATIDTDADDSSTTSTIPPHLHRSTSHSSVAVNSTASSSLSQPMGDSSSYIYHVPGRMISRGRSRSQSRVHAHMHTHNIPTLSLKRSSSHSTVALHRTNHHFPVPPSHYVPSDAPHGSAMTTPLNYSNAVGPEPLYDSYHHHHHNGQVYGAGGRPSYSRSLSQDQYGGMTVTQSAYGVRHNKVYEPWTSDIDIIESQFPRMFKHIEHSTPSRAGSGSRRRKTKPSDFPPIPSAGGNSQPDSLHYSMAPPPSSSYRHKYHPSLQPHSLVELDGPGVSAKTHFGSSSRFQPSPPGIAPHLVTAHPSPPHHHHHHHSRAAAPVDSVRRKRVTLHPPRGKKVASLV